MPLSIDVRSDAQLLISFQFKLEGTETYTMCYGWSFHMIGEVCFKLFYALVRLIEINQTLVWLRKIIDKISFFLSK